MANQAAAPEEEEDESKTAGNAAKTPKAAGKTGHPKTAQKPDTKATSAAVSRESSRAPPSQPSDTQDATLTPAQSPSRPSAPWSPPHKGEKVTLSTRQKFFRRWMKKSAQRLRSELEPAAKMLEFRDGMLEFEHKRRWRVGTLPLRNRLNPPHCSPVARPDASRHNKRSLRHHGSRSSSRRSSLASVRSSSRLTSVVSGKKRKNADFVRGATPAAEDTPTKRPRRGSISSDVMVRLQGVSFFPLFFNLLWVGGEGGECLRREFHSLAKEGIGANGSGGRGANSRQTFSPRHLRSALRLQNVCFGYVLYCIFMQSQNFLALESLKMSLGVVLLAACSWSNPFSKWCNRIDVAQISNNK